MQIPASNAQPLDLLAHVLAASLRADAGPALQPALPGPYPASVADLVYAIVTGDPSPMQLQSTKTHFRDINRMEAGATALRQLRMVTMQHGRYPTLAFAADSLSLPLLTFVQTPGAPLTEADEALRAAVAEVSQMQLRLVSHQYISLLGGTMADAHRQLLMGRRPDGDPAGAVALQDAQATMTQAAATLDRPLQILLPAAQAPDTAPAAPGGGPMRAARPRPHPRLESTADIYTQMLPYTMAQRTADRPMGGLVEYWTGRPDAELAARWNDINEQLRHTGVASPTLAFKKFLLGLTYSHIHRSEATRDEVAQWLVQAAAPERHALRAEAFRICDEGSAMCRDNALLTWNRLKMLMHKADALDGRYAGKLGELCHLALGSLRWKALESIGQAKIMGLHKENQQRGAAGFPLINIDPVEIMLDYQVNLAAELHLPLSVKEMAFPSLSPLTPQDIQDAKTVIRRVEADSIHVYLMLDFSPFLTEVRRQIGPAACQEVERAIYASLDGFDERVLQRLRDECLPTGDDPLSEDARREMGILVDRELRYSAWLPHANAVLAAAGMAPLPAMRIPPPAVPPAS